MSNEKDPSFKQMVIAVLVLIALISFFPTAFIVVFVAFIGWFLFKKWRGWDE